MGTDGKISQHLAALRQEIDRKYREQIQAVDVLQKYLAGPSHTNGVAITESVGEPVAADEPSGDLDKPATDLDREEREVANKKPRDRQSPSDKSKRWKCPNKVTKGYAAFQWLLENGPAQTREIEKAVVVDYPGQISAALSYYCGYCFERDEDGWHAIPEPVADDDDDGDDGDEPSELEEVGEQASDEFEQLLDNDNQDDAEVIETIPVLVAPKSQPSSRPPGRWAVWREQIREYLQTHGSIQQSEIKRLFGVPQGSIGTMLFKQDWIEEFRKDKFTFYRLVGSGSEQVEQVEQIELGDNDDPQDEQDDELESVFDEHADDEPFYSYRTQQQSEAANAAPPSIDTETLTERVAEYLRIHGPTKYGFIAGAMNARLDEMIEVLDHNPRFVRVGDGNLVG